MNASKSVIRGAGFLAGSLLVLLTACTSASVSTASLSQAASWPEPARIRGLKQQLAASEAKNGKDHPDLVASCWRSPAHGWWARPARCSG
jgi:hypothetical protein